MVEENCFPAFRTHLPLIAIIVIVIATGLYARIRTLTPGPTFSALGN